MVYCKLLFLAALSKPFHCSHPIANWVKKESKCSSDNLLLVEPMVNNALDIISIWWRDWSTLEGQIDTFEYSVYSLEKSNGSELTYSKYPVLTISHLSESQNGDASSILYSSLFSGGSYAVVLKAVSGNQISLARRFMVIGSNSRLILLLSKCIVFSSAAPLDSTLPWQTTSNGFSVSWAGCFANSLFHKKPWMLNRVKKDSRIPNEYDQLNGPFSRNGRLTRQGIIQFQIAYQITRHRMKRTEAEQMQWQLDSSLDESTKVNVTLYSGDRVQVWVNAADIFDNIATSSADLYVDMSPPELTKFNVTVMPEPRLQDFTDDHFSALGSNSSIPAVFLYVAVEDCESGVDQFEWKLGNRVKHDLYGFKSQVVSISHSVANHNSKCECSLLGECSQLEYDFQIKREEDRLIATNSEYYYNVVSANRAGLRANITGNGTAFHQSETIDWNLHITSSTALSAHWTKVINGMMVAVIVCEAEVNVTNCNRSTVAGIEGMSVHINGLKKYRQYAVQLQVLNNNAAAVTLSSIRVNRTHEDSK